MTLKADLTRKNQRAAKDAARAERERAARRVAKARLREVLPHTYIASFGSYYSRIWLDGKVIGEGSSDAAAVDDALRKVKEPE